MSNRWIDEYMLVEGWNPQGLAIAIKDLLSGGLGWQPHGGPVSDGGHLIQAMVRYEKED